MFQPEHSALCSDWNILGGSRVITLSYYVCQALILLRVEEVPKYRHLQTDSFEFMRRLSSGCRVAGEKFELLSRYVLMT
jgi:hypothetical protein